MLLIRYCLKVSFAYCFLTTNHGFKFSNLFYEKFKQIQDDKVSIGGFISRKVICPRINGFENRYISQIIP